MTDPKKVGVSTGSTYPVGNKEEDFNKDSVEELSGRYNRHEVSKTAADSQMVAESETERGHVTTEGKSIKERRDVLAKQPGFNEIFNRAEKKPLAKSSVDTPLKSEPAVNSLDNAERPGPELFDLTRELLLEMKTKNVITENETVRGIVMQEADGVPVQSPPDLDGLASTVGEALPELQQKPQAKKILFLGGVLTLYRSLRRLVASCIVHKEGAVKAKHFHAIPDKVLQALEGGSKLKGYAEEYNAVLAELRETKKTQDSDATTDTDQFDKSRNELKKTLMAIHGQISVELARQADKAALGLSAESLSITDQEQLSKVAKALKKTIDFDPRKVKIESSEQSYDKASFDEWWESVGGKLPLTAPPKPPRLHDAHASVDGLAPERDDVIAGQSGSVDVSEAFPAPPPELMVDVSDQLPAPPDEVMNDTSSSPVGGGMPQASDDSRSNWTIGPFDDFPPPPPPELMADPDELTQESPAANASATQSRSRGEKPEVLLKPADYPGKGKSKKE